MIAISHILNTLFVFLAIILNSGYSQAQTNLPPLKQGWQRTFIDGIGTIDIPPTMEVQDGAYKKYNDAFRMSNGLEQTNFTAQPKGINDLSSSGLDRYSRVIIETTFGSHGEFDNLYFSPLKYGSRELAELNQLLNESIQEAFYNTGLRLIEWYPASIETINGMSAIHISYKRQLNNNPHVIVNSYYFQNTDRMHTLTLSYRLIEEPYWKEDLSTVLSSFYISNIIK